MKHFNLTTKITVCTYDELNNLEKKLVDAAKEATRKAYAPYSGFQVGAAVLLENNEVITGNNQENAAYPSGLCAERTTLFYANAHYPNQKPLLLAIAAYTNGNFVEKAITPCGACRQVLLEAENRYGHPIRTLLYGKSGIYMIESVRELLPLSFDDSQLHHSIK